MPQNTVVIELDKSKKDMALVLEVLFGLFFVLGVGWIYAGNKVRGGILLVGTLLFSAPAMFSIITATGGIGFFCCALPTYLLMATDILALRRWLEKPVIENFGTMFKKGCIIWVIWVILVGGGIFLLIKASPILLDFLQHGFR